MNSKAICVFFIVLIAIALAVGNPYSISWPLKCPLYWITGFQCPLCGMQRAIHEIAHGNIIEAWHLNAGLILCTPYIFVMIFGQLYSPSMDWKIMKWCYQDKIIFSVVLLMLFWGIIRNI